jgi:hypothetical protein
MGEGDPGNCLAPGPGAGVRSLLAGRHTGAGTRLEPFLYQVRQFHNRSQPKGPK